MPEMDNTIQSVERAFTILELLCQKNELGISELSREIGLGKSTIHRMISTLCSKQLVEKTSSGKYRLTFKLFEMGNALINRLGIREEARALLEKMAKTSGETVSLAILDNNEVMYIDRIESTEPLRMGLSIGKHVPAFCTSLGKVMLAYLPEYEREAVLHSKTFSAKYRQLTPKTIYPAKELHEHLRIVAEKGYALDDEEYISGLRCVAAPVFSHEKKVVAAVSIAGPAVRMTHERIAQCIPLVVKTAQELSERLGFR